MSLNQIVIYLFKKYGLIINKYITYPITPKNNNCDMIEVNLVNLQKKEVSSLEHPTCAPTPAIKPNPGRFRLLVPFRLTIVFIIYTYVLFFPPFPTI